MHSGHSVIILVSIIRSGLPEWQSSRNAFHALLHGLFLATLPAKFRV